MRWQFNGGDYIDDDTSDNVIDVKKEFSYPLYI